MTKLVSVEGHSHLKRDPETNCIINTDQEAFNSIVKRRELEEQQKNDIANLKSEMADVKDMLSNILRILSK
jgi:hypothetical protein